jgi:hypothetical protein
LGLRIGRGTSSLARAHVRTRDGHWARAEPGSILVNPRESRVAMGGCQWPSPASDEDRWGLVQGVVAEAVNPPLLARARTYARGDDGGPAHPGEHRADHGTSALPTTPHQQGALPVQIRGCASAGRIAVGSAVFPLPFASTTASVGCSDSGGSTVNTERRLLALPGYSPASTRSSPTSPPTPHACSRSETSATPRACHTPARHDAAPVRGRASAIGPRARARVRACARGIAAGSRLHAIAHLAGEGRRHGEPQLTQLRLRPRAQ